MQVMGIGAHPDDLEVLCGGTLAKFRARGDDVIMCHASWGDLGHYKIMPEELSRIRSQEAKAAAQVIGAQAMELGFFDMRINYTEEAQRRVADAIREARPDLVITHHPNDYHSDHNGVTQLVLHATFAATVPHFETGHPYLPKLPMVYFMDTLFGLNFQPTDYVDISDYIGTKKEMLSKHQSQLAWLKEHDEVDIVENMVTVNRFRGLQCNVLYAEGIQKFQVWGRTAPGTLLP